MDSLEDLKMSLLNFNFIYMFHKMLALINITRTTLKRVFLDAFSKIIIDLYFFINNFFQTYNDGKFKSRRRKHNERYNKSF